MTHPRHLALVVALLAMTGSFVAQDAPPAGAFKTVHLVSLTPQGVAALQAWISDVNAAIEKSGHKGIRYRLYKVTGKQAGKYEFMWESSWPSGAVYTTIHNSPDYKVVGSKHPDIDALMKDEIYNRYVEVASNKR